RPWRSPDVVVGALVAGAVVVGVAGAGDDVVVRPAGAGFAAFLGAAVRAGCVADFPGVVLPGASSIPDPAGVGARPIESREIALAANPTPTARASTTMPSTTILLMAPPSVSPVFEHASVRWRPGSGPRLARRRP